VPEGGSRCTAEKATGRRGGPDKLTDEGYQKRVEHPDLLVVARLGPRQDENHVWRMDAYSTCRRSRVDDIHWPNSYEFAHAEEAVEGQEAADTGTERTVQHHANRNSTGEVPSKRRPGLRWGDPVKTFEETMSHEEARLQMRHEVLDAVDRALRLALALAGFPNVVEVLSQEDVEVVRRSRRDGEVVTVSEEFRYSLRIRAVGGRGYGSSDDGPATSRKNGTGHRLD